MAGCVGLKASDLVWPKGKVSDELEVLKPGHAFEIPSVLFAKIAPEQIAAWEAQFGGAPAA
jgi:methionyl-tRNA synthetase